jgi:antitoxin MazE
MFKQCVAEDNMARIEAVLDLKQWGNNLGVRLPAAVARAAHLHVDQKVRITVEEGHVIIAPVESELSLDQRLALFDPAKHGGEMMAVEPVGVEKW